MEIHLEFAFHGRGEDGITNWYDFVNFTKIVLSLVTYNDTNSEQNKTNKISCLY